MRVLNRLWRARDGADEDHGEAADLHDPRRRPASGRPRRILAAEAELDGRTLDAAAASSPC